MPVREGCRQLPPTYVAYFGPLARTLALKGPVEQGSWTCLADSQRLCCIESRIPSFSSLAICRRARDSFAVALHSPSENWVGLLAAAILVRTESHLSSHDVHIPLGQHKLESHHASTLLLVHATPSPHFLPLQWSSPLRQNLHHLHRLSTRHRHDYANPPATGHSLVREHIQHRYQQHMDFIAEAVGEVWSVYSLSQFSISIN
jgi:hypothetical protein